MDNFGMTLEKIEPKGKKSKRIEKIFKQRYLLIMLFPSVLFIFVFYYLTLSGWIIAFKNYQIGINIFHVPWAGMSYFQRFFFQGNDYIYLLRNTLVMNISTIIVNLTASLIFAILINEIRKQWFKKLVQTISFFPFFISWVIVYAVVYALFGASTGAINESLLNLGLIKDGINVLGDQQYSWILIVFLQLWKYIGYNSIIFIASIAAIPADQYESAEIDGASRIGKIIHVTIPNLIPTFIVLLILNSGWVLNSDFELFYLFTNPTNWQTMEVLDMYIYKYGLQLGDFSYATAVGMVKTIVSLIVVISVNALSKKLTEKSVF